MKKLTSIQKNSAKILISLLNCKVDNDPICIHILQQDPETGSLLCKIEYETQHALVWMRVNGSIGAVDGTRILLANGKLPRKSPVLDSFLVNTNA